MPRISWRAIAEALAERVAAYADCEAHRENRPDPECPFCGDRAAYQRYLDAGGRDFRPSPADGPSLSLAEIRQTAVPGSEDPDSHERCP